MSKPIKPAYTPYAPHYRVSPDTRSGFAIKQRIKGGKDAAPRLTAARQTPQAGTKTVVDQLQRLEVHELVYPGSGTDIKPVYNKWVYVFDLSGKKCIIEALGKRASFADVQTWSFRSGTITPASLKNPPELKSWSAGLITFPEDTFPVNALCRVFLTPVRLTPRALQYLLDQLAEVGQGNRAFPFVIPSTAPPSDLVAYVPDPFAWSHDASAKYYLPKLNEWLVWAQDPERAAKRFIAAQHKVWYESGMRQFANDLNAQYRTLARLTGVDGPGVLTEAEVEKFAKSKKTVGEAHLEKDTAENDERQKVAEQACAYVVSCTDSHEHRAVEIACEETGGGAVEGALAHWGLVLMGLESTAPGRTYLHSLADQNDRMPMKYVFNHPPSNSPDFKTSVLARAGAGMILGRLGPAVMRLPSQNVARPGTDDEVTAPLQAIADAANRVYEGRARFNAVASVIKASGITDPNGDWSRAASGDESGRQTKITVAYGALDAIPAAGIDLDHWIDDSELDDALKGSTFSILESIERDEFATKFFPIALLKNVIDLSSSIMAWTGSVSKEASLSDGPMAILAADPGTLLSNTAKGGQITTSLLKALGHGPKNLMDGLNSGFGYIGGLVELAGQSKGAARSFAHGNYGTGVGQGMSVLGTGTSTLASALGLANAMAATKAAAAGAAYVPVFAPVAALAMIGIGIVLIGAFIVHMFKKTPMEEFFENCFLGSKHGRDPVTGFAWTDEALPMNLVVDQAQLLIYLFSAVHVQRQGFESPGTFGKPPARESGVRWKLGGNATAFADDAFRSDGKVSGSWIRINLGHFPPGSHLEVVVKQRYGILMDDRKVVGETGFMRFTHASPGEIVRTHTSTGTLELVPYFDYAIDGKTVRSLRFPLLPTKIANWEVWEPERYLGVVRAQNCLVKVRVSIAGQRGFLRAMPYGSRWCKFDSVESDSAHALDPGSYML